MRARALLVTFALGLVAMSVPLRGVRPASADPASAAPAAPAPTAAAPDHNAHRFTNPLVQRWWATVTALANDDMRGRQTGSLEHLKAAQYMADQFKALGLAPGAGGGSYLQPVPFIARRVRESECRLELAYPDHVEPVALGEDATLQMGSDAADSLDAPAVFIGYGLSVPEQHFDEVGPVDLAGKLAVFVMGTPKGVTEPRRTQAKSMAARWAALRAKGALGMVMIRVPGKNDIPWARAIRNRFSPSMSLADSAVDDRLGIRLGVNWNAERFDKLLAGSGHTAQELFALADSGAPLPGFALPCHVRARVRYDRWPVESQNVVAVLPGSDPKLKDEYVLVTAHLDHLGVGAPVDGDSIYNGAMDNASGVASILEVARTLASRKGAARPRRSVAFVCVTGEEKGLLGSYYYARRPTLPASELAADVNVDMVLPIVPFRHVIIYGVDESDLGDIARREAKAMGIEVMPDPEPERNIFIRSDQFSFIRDGVPALMFDNAAPKGTPEFDAFKAWIHTRYHQPSDDLDQPLDPQAPADIIEYSTRIVEDAANLRARPRWKQASFFRQFASAR